MYTVKVKENVYIMITNTFKKKRDYKQDLICMTKNDVFNH